MARYSGEGGDVIHIVSWFWGQKYKPYFITKLRDALQRNMTQPHTFNVVSPGAALKGQGFNSWSIADLPLLNEPGDVVRLRLFDWKWLEGHGIRKGDKVVDLDIDSIVTGPLDPLFDKFETFTILQHINTTNPNPYNGSIWMFKAGEYDSVWEDFSLEALREVPKHSIYDDQAWVWAKIPNANAWTPVEDGIYGFKKKGWPSGDALPDNARLVVFPGRRDPRKLGHLDWVKKHWGTKYDTE